MPKSNLAVTLTRGASLVANDQPRLRLVARNLQLAMANSGEERSRFADRLDTLILACALAAGIIGYTAFGILAVAGK